MTKKRWQRRKEARAPEILEAALACFRSSVLSLRTVSIAALVVTEPAWQHGAAVIEDLARKAFQNLWRLDFLAMARTPARPTN